MFSSKNARLKKSIYKFLGILFLVLLLFAPFLIDNLPATAATSGQTTFYFSNFSDADETYGSLSLSPPTYNDIPTNLTPGRFISNDFNPAAPTLCRGGGGMAENMGVVGGNAGDHCFNTFISPPINSSFTMSTADANAISGSIYTAEDDSHLTANPTIRIYRYSGSGTTLNTTDLVYTFIGADPGTTIAAETIGPATPSNTVTFNTGDRIAAVVTGNVTGARSGSGLALYLLTDGFNPAAHITINYTFDTPNKPSLTGTYDDDFNTAMATTACSTSGTTFNTKWSCLQGSASNSSGSMNDEDLTPTSSGGDSSGWLWLKNTCGSGSGSCTGSDFGTTPSNTFLYQSLPANYTNGTVRTALNFKPCITSFCDSPPKAFVGIVLWSSNTDYLEVDVYNDAYIGSSTTDSVKVALNKSGTLSGATSLNPPLAASYDRVWIGFSNTNGSYQAQYSTNGSTWTNIGSPVSHSTFSRTGLNSFMSLSDTTTPAGENEAAAFDWFASTMQAAAATTLSQNHYRWRNDDGYEAGGNVSAGIVRPNADVTTAWTVTGAASHFGALAAAGDQVTQPTAGSTSESVSSATANQADTYDMGTLSGSGSYNEVDVWVYAKAATNDKLGVSTNIAGTTQQTVTLTTSNAWYKVSFTGLSMTQTDLDGLRITFTQIKNGGSDTVTVYTMYAEVFNSLTAATYKAAQDTVVSGVSTGSNVRLRFEVANTDTKSGSPNLSLEYGVKSGTCAASTYSTIPTITGSAVQMGTSTYFATGDATTSQLTATGTFTAGKMVESNSTSTGALTIPASNYTEAEFVFQGNASAAGNTYCFRLTNNGTALTTYSVYPEITFTGGVSPPTTDQLMRGGRYFNSGTEQPYYWAQ
jgi:hypothetical protein